MDLKTIDFIKHNPDWEKTLSEAPYCLTITRDKMLGKNLVMLKYSQVDSDFNEAIVRECRGLILDADTNEIVSFPFTKFFNFGETNAAEIDWKSASILQKVDGSLIKVVKIDGQLLVSTNGTIDAYKAPVQDQIGFIGKTFGGLFELVLADAMANEQKGKACLDWLLTPTQWLSSKLQEGFTYMFELVSPYTRVVVPWKKSDIYFLGLRDNTTFEEQLPYGHPLASIFNTPARFNLHTLDECIAATKQMPWDEEGYVVVDKDFNRVKIKSPAYVAAHNLKGNGVMSISRALEIIKLNEIDEICAYFPEFKAGIDALKKKIADFVESAEKSWAELKSNEASLPDRKSKAQWILSHFKSPAFAFAMLDGKTTSALDWLYNLPIETMSRMIGAKEA